MLPADGPAQNLSAEQQGSSGSGLPYTMLGSVTGAQERDSGHADSHPAPQAVPRFKSLITAVLGKWDTHSQCLVQTPATNAEPNDRAAASIAMR
jgi:hypothetical protein